MAVDTWPRRLRNGRFNTRPAHDLHASALLDYEQAPPVAGACVTYRGWFKRPMRCTRNRLRGGGRFAVGVEVRRSIPSAQPGGSPSLRRRRSSRGQDPGGEHGGESDPAQDASALAGGGTTVQGRRSHA